MCCFSDLYPSSYEEWQLVKCILGFLDVLHVAIGELQYQCRSGNQLVETCIFFYDHFYKFLDRANTHNVLKRIDLPPWNLIDWPVPPHSVTMTCRAKLFIEVQ